jgi:GNAT superfamily N-acetyltransferase
MSSLEVKQLTADDWQIDRELRLAALADAPFAFASNLADEERISADAWRERLANRVKFHARLDGVDVGAIGVFLNKNGTTAELVAMWVHPIARGQGAGDALVQAVLSWARDAGATEVHLWLASGNVAAERLYARNGFVPSDEEQPIDPADPTRTEIGMTCHIGSTRSNDSLSND